MKLKTIIAILLFICSVFVYCACDSSTDFANIELVENVFTYTGEEIKPVFSSVPSGCDIEITNDKNEKTKIIDAGAYFVKIQKGGKTKLFNITVNKKELEIELESKTVKYNGEKQSVSYTFNYELNCDYAIEVTYNNETVLPINSGEYRVEAKLKCKNYLASATSVLTIEKQSCELDLTQTSYVYTGNEIMPNITTNCCEEYEVTYKNLTTESAIDKGYYTFEISLESENYYSTITKEIEILPKQIEVELKQNQFEYSGEIIDIKKYIQYNSDINFTIYTNDVLLQAGEYEVTITPVSSNYIGEYSGNITINKKEVSLSFEPQTYVFNNNNIEYKIEDETYRYKIKYNNSETLPFNTGEYNVEIELDENNFYGSASTTLEITKKNIDIELVNENATYTGEEINVSFNTSLNISKSVFYNENQVDKICGAGRYEIIAEIIEDNYYGTKTLYFEVLRKEVEITFNTTNYEYTSYNIALDYSLSNNVKANVMVYYNDEEVANIKDIGTYKVVVIIDEANFVGTKIEYISVDLISEESKLKYAIDKFYELNSYNLSGSFTIKFLNAGLIYQYIYNSIYENTSEYFSYREDYIANNPFNNNISFFLYCENENYEYEVNKTANVIYYKNITGERESDISNLGIVPFNILKHCDFVSCNDGYEYSFNAIKLGELEKYYSYIFESECVFNACNVKIKISNNGIDNINISLDFNTVMLEENVKVTAVVNYSNN